MSLLPVVRKPGPRRSRARGALRELCPRPRPFPRPLTPLSPRHPLAIQPVPASPRHPLAPSSDSEMTPPSKKEDAPAASKRQGDTVPEPQPKAKVAKAQSPPAVAAAPAAALAAAQGVATTESRSTPPGDPTAAALLAAAQNVGAPPSRPAADTCTEEEIQDYFHKLSVWVHRVLEESMKTAAPARRGPNRTSRTARWSARRRRTRIRRPSS